MSSFHVAVIIPFYQRESGILDKAIASVNRQIGDYRLLIIVVDDESPVPPANALTVLAAPDNIETRLIHQQNTGPAGARNTGIDNVPDDVDYVAFLDSDDEWTEEHLHSAITGLSRGYDLYFANHVQLGASTPAFERAGKLNLENHRRLFETGRNIYAFDGDMLGQIISGNLIGTSTVVYHRDRLRKLRFHDEFVYAGEDYLFWMDACQCTDRFVFSTDVEAIYGEGVNVYSGSGWGTPNSLRRIVDELHYRVVTMRRYRLTRKQKVVIDEKIALLRREFVLNMLHRLSHRKSLEPRLFLAFLRHDPALALHVIPLLLDAARAKTGRQVG